MNDREKLADTMIELKGYLEEIYEFPTLDCFLKELAMQLVAHGVTFQQWIPVTERLPEAFVSVLVQMPGEKPFPTVREGFISSNGVWHSAYFDRESDEVTHWMPMPEPPKGE